MEKIQLTSERPMVSVIIPVFNAAGFLNSCIRSVRSQTWTPLEIIIVDDGSTDNSFEIASSFQAADVQVIRQKNKGASAARNRGLTFATGQFIQFLDADDLLSEDKIEQQMLILTSQQDSIAVCSTIHFPNGEPHETYTASAYEERFFADIGDPVTFLTRLLGGHDFEGSMVQPGAWLTPMNIIEKAGRWDETLSLDDDGEFFSRVILASTKVFKTKGFVFYRKYDKSMNNLSGRVDQRGLESLFRSTMLKAEHLYASGKNENTEKAVYKQLVELQVRCYLTEPILFESISLELKQLPAWGFKPPMGGKIINKISAWFGWKLAKRIQLSYRLIKRWNH